MKILAILILALCTASTYAAEKEWSMFTAIDKSKDGEVTQAEWTQWKQKQAKKKNADFSMKASIAEFKELDSNKDGHLTEAEMGSSGERGKKGKKDKKTKKEKKR